MDNSFVRKLDREKHLALTGAVLLSLISFCGIFFRVRPPDYPDLISNIMYPLSSLVGASWAFLTAYRARRGPLRLPFQQQLAWLLVGAGLLANTLGSLYYTYLDRSGQTILVPSLSDLGFTLFYPIMFVGLFLLPTAQRFRLRMALDALITTLSVLGVSWFFFISKVFVAQIEARVSVPALIMVISYPFWDMLLLLALLLLFYRRTNANLLPSFLLLGIGLLANIWADTSYAYSLAVSTYDTVNFLIDPFWYLAFLLVGLSGLYQYVAMARTHFKKRESIQRAGRVPQRSFTSTDEKTYNWSLTQNMLVYLPLAILLILVLYSESREFLYNQKGSLFLIVLTAVVGVLVALRSLVATRENERLLHVLAKAKEEQVERTTELAHLYEELQHAHRGLQELDKLKDQFMITASHELRTPLTSVQGYLELLVEYGHKSSPEQQQEFLLKAQRSSEELVLLLSNVMDASRLEVDAGIRPAHLQSVSVNEVVHSVVDIIEPQVTKQQRKIVLQVPTELFVQADPARLRQVLLNLSVNAMKYSAEGSPITFSAHLAQESPRHVIVSVIDTGKGVLPKDQKRLFQKFSRLERDLDSEVRGSGLGLYISRRLIEAMGGKIWIESRGIPGEGSSFNIQLSAPE